MTIAKLITLSLLLFAQKQNLCTLNNGWPDKNGTVGRIQISVITENQAKDLFKAIIAAKKNIPFEYTTDGCYARATAMARMAERQGIVMGKIFVHGSLYLDVLELAYHVAPVVCVETPDGSQKKMVFDPSLFEFPVTILQWEEKMLTNRYGRTGTIDESYFGSRYQYFHRHYEEKKDAWSQSDLDDAERVLSMCGRISVLPAKIEKTKSSDVTGAH